MNPREECSNLGTMVCWHRRYSLGDEQPSESPDEWIKNMSGLDDEQLENAKERFYNVLAKANPPKTLSDEIALWDRSYELLAEKCQNLFDQKYISLPKGCIRRQAFSAGFLWPASYRSAPLRLLADRSQARTCS